MKKLLALLLAVLLLTGCTPKPVPPQETEPVTETQPTTEPTHSEVAPGLSVHFLDVQHADCILLAC